MTYNLFAVKPKSDRPKANIFSIPSFTKETVKEEKETAPEPVIEKVEEPVQEDTAMVETVEEPAQKETPAVEASEEKEETPASEDNPEKKKRGRKSKQLEEKEKLATAESSSVAFENAGFAPAAIKINKVKETFAVNFQDDEWKNKKEELEKRAENIRIEPDINLGSVRILLAQCTNLYSDLKREQRSNKTLYNVICDKTIGLIQRQQQINANGKNNEDRKKNSVLSCEQFKMKDNDNKEYNLYDLAMIMQDRIDTINDLLDDVKQKKETLISYLAVLKLENGMVK